MSFDPKKHIIRIQGGREYLPVAARLVWFRGEHPDWGIVTSPIEINMEKQYAIFSCQIFNADGKLMATATKMENIRGFGDWLEKSETGAVGRALAYCGYGTQFAPELDEEERLADAPYPAQRSAPANGNGPKANNGAAKNGGGPGSSGVFTRVREPDRVAANVPEDDEDDDEAIFAEVDPMPAEDSAPAAPAKANPLAGNKCSVDGCPNVLTAGQMTMSMNKYGRSLCLLHQKDAQPLATPVGGSGGGQPGRRGPDPA